MKNARSGSIAKALCAAARVFDRMDIFPMRVLAGAMAVTALMLAAACAALIVTYCSGAAAYSLRAYENTLWAQELFGGGLRLLSAGCISAVLIDILLRSQSSVL